MDRLLLLSLHHLIVAIRLDFFVNVFVGSLFNNLFYKFFIFYFFFVKQFILNFLNFELTNALTSWVGAITTVGVLFFTRLLFLFLLVINTFGILLIILL